LHLNSFLFDQEPTWKIDHPGVKQTMPPEIQSWVYEKNSLTERLRQYYGGAVQVEILFHQWRPAFLGEARQLKLPTQRFNLIREVLLHANGVPLILARTILPEKTIRAAHRNLSHLGTRPLGEVIFSYPNLERQNLNTTLLSPAQWSQELQQRVPIDDNIWGRRTVYIIKKKRLLVSEFFLPATRVLI
jgi:chorismate--pyruvate lyase